MGTLDHRFQTLLSNMGFVHDFGGTHSSAMQYQLDGNWSIGEAQRGYREVSRTDASGKVITTQQAFSPNEHIVSEAPEHIQQLLGVRDHLRDDPLGAALHYMGLTVSDIQKRGSGATDGQRQYAARTAKRMAQLKAGEAVNPFEVLDHVKLFLPGSAGGINANTLLSSSNNPVMQARIEEGGETAATKVSAWCAAPPTACRSARRRASSAGSCCSCAARWKPTWGPSRTSAVRVRAPARSAAPRTPTSRCLSASATSATCWPARA